MVSRTTNVRSDDGPGSIGAVESGISCFGHLVVNGLRVQHGAPAEIGDQAGAAFSCFGGMITGRHIEMAAGQRLIQAWRAANWDPGVYSVVRFELSAEGNGSRLTFDHTGCPEAMREHLEDDWKKCIGKNCVPIWRGKPP